MQPTTPNPGRHETPQILDGVIDIIRTQRQNVAIVLAFFALACLLGTGYVAIKASRIQSKAPDATKNEKDQENLLKPNELDGSSVTQPNRTEYIAGGVGAFLLFAVFAATAGFLVAAPSPRKEEEQRTQARVVFLLAGSCLGAALILSGAFFFYWWSGSLVQWLDKGEVKEARWVLIPLLVVVMGGAVMFLCAQPARAEERNNTNIRRVVYGSNFGLTILMVFVVLVIANAIIALRVTNRLDTTSNSFYTLNPQTKQLIETLEQPLHAYAIFQGAGDPIAEDTKRLLLGCQELNPGKFRVTFLSPALNKTEITKLRSDYPLAEMSQEGVLLVVGDESSPERKRHTYLRSEEFEEVKRDDSGRQTLAFNGEPKLLREMMFLAENKQKPKVYFTQSSGELSLSGESQNPQRSAAKLKAYLEKNYFDVAELKFNLNAPTQIPVDAAIVVIADPTEPIPPNGVEALRKFMTEPRQDGRKGKLIVLAGAQQGADRKPLKLGIEPLLQTFGVRVSDRFMYQWPMKELADLDRSSGTRVSIAVVTKQAVSSRNAVAMNFENSDRFPLLDCREVSSVPVGEMQSVPVFVTMPGRRSWVEETYQRRPDDALEQILGRVRAIGTGPGTDADKERALIAIQEQHQISQSPRGLAVFVNEGSNARVAVFGCGWLASDDAAGLNSGTGTSIFSDLMGSTLDWVRDRPTVGGVTEKPYSTYTLKPGYDSLRMIWLPLGLAILIAGGFGAGIWVIRRK
jgi:uncharacterized membrane protein